MESLSFGPLNSLCVDDPNMSESGVFRYSRRAKSDPVYLEGLSYSGF